MDVTIVTVSRPETTATVTRGAARFLTALGYAPLTEVTLPNGRRADLMALGPKGEIFIVEVKSGVEDFRVDLKWPEYRPYCDASPSPSRPSSPARSCRRSRASSSPTASAARSCARLRSSRWPAPGERR